jgi:hypothetical protein
MKPFVMSLALIMLLAGCFSSGNGKVRTETMDTVGTKVTKGLTTKAQVKAIYGDPGSVGLSGAGSEVWTYEYTRRTAKAVDFVPIVGLFAGGADVNKNEVVFIFDKNDIMQNYTVHASKTETHHGGSAVGQP